MARKRPIDESLLEFIYVRPEAVEPLRIFLDKMDDLEENGIVRKCGDNYEAYTEQENLTVDEAEELCYGCPLLKQCYDYAVADQMVAGVWGGVDFTPQTDTLFELGEEEDYNDF